MNEMTKESKFLEAINKYAESQKAQITKEIEDYKNTKIEQATEQGLQDAYDLIRREIVAGKSAIVNDTAKRELELKRKLFSERTVIAQEVFAAARQKLVDFTASEAYADFLRRSCQGIRALFHDENCVVSVAQADEKHRELIASLLPHAEIIVDRQIRIGGVKAFCKAQGITADDTLDTRLHDQRAWFFENSGLEVV